ncbi:MAG: BtpA/SgcQ family protein [Desulfurococcales archaeon]|nr:BtpA/SgcQ family protein [Desulfurococcales archaeon]
MRGSELLERCKPIIGVVHLPPLPGSPGYGRRPYPLPYGPKYTFNDIIEYAIEEAKKYESAGFDGVIIENYGDKPYSITPPPESVAAISIIAREVAKNISIALGISLLRNAPHLALAAAHMSGASIIRANSLCEVRVSPEGIMMPAARDLAEKAAYLGLYDSLIKGDIIVIADVDVKHSAPLGSWDPIAVVEECQDRAGIPVRAIAVTGPRTGVQPSQEYLDNISSSARRLGISVFVGSGVTSEIIPQLWRSADGFIVGTAAKLGGKTENVVSLERAKRIAQMVERYRKVWPCAQFRGE